MHWRFFYLDIVQKFGILYIMKKQIIVVRRVCVYCGAKRNSEKMMFLDFDRGDGYACKNNDLCVLKMAYLKKVSKK